MAEQRCFPEPGSGSRWLPERGDAAGHAALRVRGETPVAEKRLLPISGEAGAARFLGRPCRDAILRLDVCERGGAGGGAARVGLRAPHSSAAAAPAPGGDRPGAARGLRPRPLTGGRGPPGPGAHCGSFSGLCLGSEQA